jgi:6-pyruvoyltetrahydropterin/6-carboxytetrahydropterin synthase
MFEVLVKGSFSAAHSIEDIGGKCENLHGHNFAVEVSITSGQLNGQGLVIDFRALKSCLNEILELLDHKFLNELAPFLDCSPTSEHIARFIYGELKNKIKQKGIDTLMRVNVWESDTSRASYWEDER